MTTPDSSGSNSSTTSIYDSLIAEHGDVVAETRQAAEQIEQEASQALDWSELRARS